MWDWADDLLGKGGMQHAAAPCARPRIQAGAARRRRRPSLLVQGGGGNSGLWDFLGDDATSPDEDEEEEEKDENEDEEERYLPEKKKKRVVARVGSAIIERWALLPLHRASHLCRPCKGLSVRLCPTTCWHSGKLCAHA